MNIPEMTAVKALFEQSHYGLSFTGDTKQRVGEAMKRIPEMGPFAQLLALLQILKELGESPEAIQLNPKPAGNKALQRSSTGWKQFTNTSRHISINRQM